MQEFVLIVLLITNPNVPPATRTAVFTTAERCRDAALELQAARDQKFSAFQLLTTCARR